MYLSSILLVNSFFYLLIKIVYKKVDHHFKKC